LACATQATQKPRRRSLPARDLNRLHEEIAKAKQRFGLPADAPVCTCYEADRDGFGLHRALTSMGISNVTVVEKSNVLGYGHSAFASTKRSSCWGPKARSSRPGVLSRVVDEDFVRRPRQRRLGGPSPLL
jgi:hypothetical protein